MHEQEKKRQYATRVLEIEKGTFTLLVFTTTGGMEEGCLRYHRRLAELNSCYEESRRFSKNYELDQG